MNDLPATMGAPPMKVPIHQWSGLHSSLLWIYDGPVDASSRNVSSDHSADHWMWLLRAGGVTVGVGRKSWSAEAGDWILCPRGIMRQKFSADAVILSVHFKCAWPTGENLFAGDEALIFPGREFPRLEQSASALEKLVRRHFPHTRLDFSLQETTYRTHLRFQMQFFQWLDVFSSALLARNRAFSLIGEAESRAYRAAEIMHQTSLKEVYPLARLEAEIGLGRAQLDRLFWASFGMTTRKYWDRLRENAAVEALDSGQLALKEIGYGLGFRQPSHFTQWFSRKRGVTPSVFREGAPRRHSGFR